MASGSSQAPSSEAPVPQTDPASTPTTSPAWRAATTNGRTPRQRVAVAVAGAISSSAPAASSALADLRIEVLARGELQFQPAATHDVRRGEIHIGNGTPLAPLGPVLLLEQVQSLDVHRLWRPVGRGGHHGRQPLGGHTLGEGHVGDEVVVGRAVERRLVDAAVQIDQAGLHRGGAVHLEVGDVLVAGEHGDRTEGQVEGASPAGRCSQAGQGGG